MRDLKAAFRSLAASPIVSLVAILSLALGIGANAAIFSLMEQTILRSLPAEAPGQLVNLSSTGPRGGQTSTNNAGNAGSIYSYPMFRDLERVQRVFTGVAAHRSFGANLAYRGESASAAGLFVSGSYFPVLGLKPRAGRLFTPGDDQVPGAHRLVVLSHAYWSEKFNRDFGALNQTLLVNGVPMTIIGVAPADFEGTTLGTQPRIYVPLSMREELTPGWKGFDNRRSYWAYLFARLKPGVTLEQAQSALEAQFLGIIREVEVPLQKGASPKFVDQFRNQRLQLTPGERGQSNLLGAAQTPLILLFSITGFVLLIACANIANLLLARSANRTKEFSIRLSLGASSGQIIRQLLTESVLLALLAGVAGVLVSYGTGQAVISFFDDTSSGMISPAPRLSTLLFSLALSVAAGLLFGLFPAVHATKQELSAAMKDQAGNVSSSAGASFFRRSLVSAQVALSLLLLISAGLFLKSLVNVMKVNLGLRTENVTAFALSPELSKYTPERSRAFFSQLEDKLRATPGVTGVTVSLVPLLAGNNWGSNVSVDGFAAGPDTDTHSMFNEVGAGYFGLFGIPLVAGREFTFADGPNAPKVAIVNEAFVRKFSPNGSAVGKRMQVGSGGKNDIEIVGVAKDTKYSEVKDAAPPLFFRPYQQDKEIGSATFYVRSNLPVEQIAPQIRRAVAGLDPNLPVEDLKTLDRQIQDNIALDRMISTMATAFACLATLLASVGLYGVLAFTITRRTREIGIRMAIGAQPGNILGMVLREVGWMIALGVGAGLPAAYGISRYAESLLFEMKGPDAAVFVGGAFLVIAVSLVAGYLPARRAMGIDPITALRYE